MMYGCEKAWADEDNVIHGAAFTEPREPCLGPFSAVDQIENTEMRNILTRYFHERIGLNVIG